MLIREPSAHPHSAREGSAKRTWPGELPTAVRPAILPNNFKASGIAMSDEKLRALPRDTPDYHARQAAHLRALAENATTARLKARLLEEAEQHEQLAAPADEIS